MTTALANRTPSALAQQPDPNGNALTFAPDQIEIIKRTVASGIKNDTAFLMFINYAQRTGLDPLKRELCGYTDNTGKLVMITEIAGFRRLGGQRAKVTQIKYWFCGEDGAWQEVWTSKKTPPIACKCSMWLKGERESIDAIIYYDEFYIEKNPCWQQKPRHMMMIRAEAHCWRKIPSAGLDALELHEEGAALPVPPTTIVETPLAETTPTYASLDAPNEYYTGALHPEGEVKRHVQPEPKKLDLKQYSSDPATTSTLTGGSINTRAVNAATPSITPNAAAPRPAVSTVPAPGSGPRVHPRTPAFAVYAKYGGNTADQEMFVVHLNIALQNPNITKIVQVTEEEWVRFTDLLERHKCLPGSENWPKEAEIVDEETTLDL